jgi:hypothetical protein
MRHHRLHAAALRFNQMVGCTLFGRFYGDDSYRRIRADFESRPVGVDDLVVQLDAGGWVASAAEILRRHGVVVLHHAVAPDLARAAKREVDGLIGELVPSSDATWGELGELLWQIDGAKLASHAAMANAGRPVANMRKRERDAPDGGMIDIFAVDMSARARGMQSLLECCARLAGVREIVAANAPVARRRFNLYRNDSVTVTRGLHIDSLAPNYKAFLYLSDVRDSGDGPYAYVPGTHRRADLVRRQMFVNTMLGRPVTNIYGFDDLAVEFLGPAGTVIIGNQSGVHRGRPQREGACRTVLLDNYS